MVIDLNTLSFINYIHFSFNSESAIAHLEISETKNYYIFSYPEVELTVLNVYGIQSDM
jgi:hypothetical protein